MTRVRVVSLRSFDPLIAGLSPKAFRAWQRSLDWACFHATDGLLTAEDIKAIGPTPAARQELLERGVWKLDEHGRTFVAELREGPVVAEVEGCEVEHAKKLPMTPAERAKRYRETHRTTSSRRRDDPRDERHENGVTNSDEKRDGRDVTVVTHGSPAPPPDLVLSGSGFSSGLSESSSVLASDPKDLTGSARVAKPRPKKHVYPESFPSEKELAELLKYGRSKGLRDGQTREELEALKLWAKGSGALKLDWMSTAMGWLRRVAAGSFERRAPGGFEHEKRKAEEEARRPYHEPFRLEPTEPKASPSEALAFVQQAGKAIGRSIA